MRAWQDARDMIAFEHRQTIDERDLLFSGYPDENSIGYAANVCVSIESFSTLVMLEPVLMVTPCLVRPERAY